MKFSAALTGAAALLATGVSAQNAVVKNNCATTIYVQSFPQDGSAPGPLTTLTTGQSFTEGLRATGSTVKIAKTKTLTTPLFFGYSFSPNNGDYTYYEFSTQWGNPFADQHNILTPGDGCDAFDCAANDAACYSSPPANPKVPGCPSPVNLTSTICA
ncbi:hypothetical protein diail_2863 [Diaporthe ilicicola]|nr:hypothetical protein diail_2863 [Diaporthe ilicicola]